jgi:ATP-binding cassette subfamily B protein AbcA/BmrA
MGQKENSAAPTSHWRKFFALVELKKLPKPLIVVVLSLSLLSTLAGLIVPWFTKDVVNVMTTGQFSMTTIALLVGAIITQAVMSSFAL